MITASSLSRLRACPSSAVLSRAENYSEWATAGHAEHEELSALDDLSPDLARLVPPGSHTEVKLAYDVATRAGRIIGEGSGRGYGSPGPFEIVGSTDAVGEENDRVVVLDWKTGFFDVEPAATNDQLWFYALAACRALGKDEAIVRIVYTKTNRVDEHEIGPLEMAEFADAIERIYQHVAARQASQQRGELLDTREGSWCRYCPSKAFCPSKLALLVQVGTHGLAAIGDSTITPERARAAYYQVTHIESLVKDARKRLETYVDDFGPIDLGEGKRFGRFARKGNEKLDGSIAVQAIREVVGESAKEFEAIAVDRKVTKAGIKRAAEQISAKGAGKLTSSVIAKIRELGGATSSMERPIGEYNADKNESAVLAPVDADGINTMLRLVP